MNDLAAFAKLVETLSPWTHQLVFVGGMGSPAVSTASGSHDACLSTSDHP